MIPPGYAQLNHVFTHPAASGDIVICPAVKLTGGPPTVAQLTTAYTDFVTDVMGQMSNKVKLAGITAYIGQDGADPLIVEYFATTPSSGSLSSINAAINTAYLVKKSTAGSGRRNRGRLYLPGVMASDLNDDDTLTTTRRNALQTGVTAWMTHLNEKSWIDDVVILHQSGVALPTVVTALVVEDLVATMRKRMRD